MHYFWFSLFPVYCTANKQNVLKTIVPPCRRSSFLLHTRRGYIVRVLGRLDRRARHRWCGDSWPVSPGMRSVAFARSHVLRGSGGGGGSRLLRARSTQSLLPASCSSLFETRQAPRQALLACAPLARTSFRCLSTAPSDDKAVSDASAAVGRGDTAVGDTAAETPVAAVEDAQEAQTPVVSDRERAAGTSPHPPRCLGKPVANRRRQPYQHVRLWGCVQATSRLSGARTASKQRWRCIRRSRTLTAWTPESRPTCCTAT